MRRYCLLLLLILMNLLYGFIIAAPECGLYGLPPCVYVPAPPGTTPSCATPGKTYCERAPHYPMYGLIIRSLLQKYGYDLHKFITDETNDEFDALRLRGSDSSFYGPGMGYISPQNTIPQDDGYKYPKPTGFGYDFKNTNKGFNNNAFSGGNDYNEPIYIPRPQQNGYPNNVNTGYNNANNGYNSNNGFSSSNGYTTQTGYNNGNNYYQEPQGYNSNHPKSTSNIEQNASGSYYFEPQQVTEYNPSDWLRRYTRDLSNQNMSAAENIKPTSKSKKTIEVVLKKKEKELSLLDDESDVIKNRQKRQSPGRQTLCEVTTQFIQPQAALNTKGNWMYVVNQDDNTARQLVKTEICATNICSNLCQLPNGYNSRCEQKYIQKRLVALSADGQNLYTDTFWFPSCCVCTLTNA